MADGRNGWCEESACRQSSQNTERQEDLVVFWVKSATVCRSFMLYVLYTFTETEAYKRRNHANGPGDNQKGRPIRIEYGA